MSRRKRLTKTLPEIVTFLKKRLGDDIVFLETSEETIEDFILDALSEVSLRKPRILATTITSPATTGVIQISEKIYPENWKKGDKEPTSSPREDVLTYLTVESHKQTAFSRAQTATNPFSTGGSILFQPGIVGYGTNEYNHFSTYITSYIDYQIINYTLNSVRGLEGSTFEWLLDQNDRSRVFYANNQGDKITVEIALEHYLGEIVVPPPPNSPDGTASKSIQTSIKGSVLHLTQRLALGLVMETIGRIRSKVQGGQNSTQLDGERMISDGQELQAAVRDSLKSGAALGGYYTDSQV